jgi:hydrogenase maturation protein HypF
MKTLHIHIEGQVQGVGFRPFVYRLAIELSLFGWVNNGVDGVHIEVEGEDARTEQFIKRLKKDAPPVARITSLSSQQINNQKYTSFKIVESKAVGKPNLLITPDIGLCEACKHELHDTSNARYYYPFSTCTHCGPRYSILKSLPYDRPTTTMEKFVMCARCKEEYTNPLDRRYYSQTNSCPDCAIHAWMVNAEDEKIADTWEESFPLLIEALKGGKIIAMKGIGGYLLLADATNAEVVKTLRSRKHRPAKPFALMYPDVETLAQDAWISDEEEREFTSIQSPIVLVRVKDFTASGICTDIIVPGLNKIGVMQPYTAMFELLMREWKKPLIATSANVSGSPILYDNQEAIRSLKTIADYFLMHNREIVIAQDDSVVQFSPKYNQRIVLRRSRGYAPTIAHDAFTTETILALGADMKSTFSLQVNGRIYTSQYLGDLESFESQESFRTTLSHMLKLVQAKPERIVIDAHPNYFSSLLGQHLAEEWNIPVQKVQHHKAHTYAVLAENNLLTSEVPVLCVVWDGTGYGDDGNIWGGEFFEYNENKLERIGQITYAPVWLGDKMAKDTRLSALFYGRNSERVKTHVKRQFSEIVWRYYSKQIDVNPDVYTSSIGRLFDAVACLTGISNVNSYEGESAMRLEALAEQEATPICYNVLWKGTALDTGNLLDQVILDIKAGIRPEMIAYKFHVYLADAIRSVVCVRGFTKIAFSGGVFQNALLVDLIKDRLSEHEVFFHKELSPNDENISFGQLALATQMVYKSRVKNKSTVISNPV